MWLPVMAALARRRTIAYDMIGHGRAAKPAGPYTLDTFVEQLGAVVDALDCDIDLVGFSMGALVAQGLALSDRSSRIRRIVLLNGVYDRSSDERRAILDRVAEVREHGLATTIEPAIERWFTPSFAQARPDVIESVRQRLLDNDERAYADAYEVFATADAELAGRVGAIAAPTLIVTGIGDQRSTPAMAEALATALPNGRSMILNRLRHLTPLEAPKIVAGLIDEFTAA
jgi:pimeloyl-ACP methyl ester carboxylesterase